MGAFGADLVGDAPIFRPREKRQMADCRRTGSVEALAGGADPEGLSAKMANSLSQSNRLHKTYAPVQLAQGRKVGRRLRARSDQATRTKISPAKHAPKRLVELANL
jgi:hypothetical protein